MIAEIWEVCQPGLPPPTEPLQQLPVGMFMNSPLTRDRFRLIHAKVIERARYAHLWLARHLKVSARPAEKRLTAEFQVDRRQHLCNRIGVVCHSCGSWP